MPQLDFDGANSKISADKIQGQSGTTVTIPAGHNLAGDGSGLTSLPAANLTGTVATARLGSGTANSTTFLRGDQTYAAPAGGGGKCLQAVHVLNNTASTTTAQWVYDTTIPQNTEGAEIMTLAITPESSSSNLHIHMQVCGSKSNAAPIWWALFVDTTADALAWGGYVSGNIAIQEVGSNFHVVASASTSARTYKVRVGCTDAAGGTVYINRNSVQADRIANTGYSAIAIYEIDA